MRGKGRSIYWCLCRDLKAFERSVRADKIESEVGFCEVAGSGEVRACPSPHLSENERPNLNQDTIKGLACLTALKPSQCYQLEHNTFLSTNLLSLHSFRFLSESWAIDNVSAL